MFVTPPKFHSALIHQMPFFSLKAGSSYNAGLKVAKNCKNCGFKNRYSPMLISFSSNNVLQTIYFGQIQKWHSAKPRGPCSRGLHKIKRVTSSQLLSLGLLPLAIFCFGEASLIGVQATDTFDSKRYSVSVYFTGRVTNRPGFR